MATFFFIVEEALFFNVTAGKILVPIDDRLDLDGLMLLNCFGSDVNVSMFASPPIVSCVILDRPNRRIDLLVERNRANRNRMPQIPALLLLLYDH